MKQYVWMCFYSVDAKMGRWHNYHKVKVQAVKVKVQAAGGFKNLNNNDVWFAALVVGNGWLLNAVLRWAISTGEEDVYRVSRVTRLMTITIQQHQQAGGWWPDIHLNPLVLSAGIRWEPPRTDINYCPTRGQQQHRRHCVMIKSCQVPAYCITSHPDHLATNSSIYPDTADQHMTQPM